MAKQFKVDTLIMSGKHLSINPIDTATVLRHDGTWVNTGTFVTTTDNRAMTWSGQIRFGTGQFIRTLDNDAAFYPDAGYEKNNDYSTGAWVFNTQIPRLSNSVFRIHVQARTAADVGRTHGMIDFQVGGYAQAAISGNIDGLPGAVWPLHTHIIDNSDINIPIWVGINKSGFVAVGFGDTGMSYYFMRSVAHIQVDWNNNFSRYTTGYGWSFETGSGFDFKDRTRLSGVRELGLFSGIVFGSLTGNRGVITTISGTSLDIGGAIQMQNSQSLKSRLANGTSIGLLTYDSSNVLNIGANNEIKTNGGILLTPPSGGNITIQTTGGNVTMLGGHVTLSGTGLVTSNLTGLFYPRFGNPSGFAATGLLRIGGLATSSVSQMTSGQAGVWYRVGQTANGNYRFGAIIDVSTVGGTTTPCTKYFYASHDWTTFGNLTLASQTNGTSFITAARLVRNTGTIQTYFDIFVNINFTGNDARISIINTDGQTNHLLATYSGAATGTGLNPNEVLVTMVDCSAPVIMEFSSSNGNMGSGFFKVDYNSGVRCSRFISQVVSGTPPFSAISRTICPNLNADLLDGLQGTDFARYTGTVLLTGSQSINGVKTFNDFTTFAGGIQVYNDVYSDVLYAISDITRYVDTYQAQLATNGLATLDWANRYLTGNWSAQGLRVSGSQVVTHAQTGIFVSNSATGNFVTITDSRALTFSDSVQARRYYITGGGQCLDLQPGIADSAYIAVYARTATPNTRSAYLGYPSSGATTLQFYNEIADGGLQLLTTSGGKIQFYPSGVQRMVVTTSGVGILTNNPQAELHVVGNILASNNISIGANSVVTQNQTGVFVTTPQMSGFVSVQEPNRNLYLPGLSFSSIQGDDYNGIWGGGFTNALTNWTRRGLFLTVLSSGGVTDVQDPQNTVEHLRGTQPMKTWANINQTGSGTTTFIFSGQNFGINAHGGYQAYLVGRLTTIPTDITGIMVEYQNTTGGWEKAFSGVPNFTGNMWIGPYVGTTGNVLSAVKFTLKTRDFSGLISLAELGIWNKNYMRGSHYLALQYENCAFINTVVSGTLSVSGNASISGSPIITAGQTGTLVPTGLTGRFYLNTNPSGYLTRTPNDLVVFQTGNQGISGNKQFYGSITFDNTINTPSISNSSNNVVDVNVATLNDSNGVESVSWGNRHLVNIGGSQTVRWHDRILTGGFWTGQGFYISGSSVVTAAQTGIFVPTGATGAFTSLFYPFSSNPNNYVTTSQTGTLVPTGLTGRFYLNSNPAGYIDSSALTSYVLSSQTGILVPTGLTGRFVQTGESRPVNFTGPVTAGYIDSTSGVFSTLNVGSSFTCTGPASFSTNFTVSGNGVVTSDATGNFVTRVMTGVLVANNTSIVATFNGGLINSGKNVLTNDPKFGVVFTTGNQTIGGIKTFSTNIVATSADIGQISNGLGIIVVYDGQLWDNGPNLCLDWVNRKLIGTDGVNQTLDWGNRMLTGTWYFQNLEGQYVQANEVYCNSYASLVDVDISSNLSVNGSVTVAGSIDLGVRITAPQVRKISTLLTYSGEKVVVNFPTRDNRFLNMTGDATFTGTNMGDGYNIKIKLYASGAGYNLQFPTGWKFITAKPVSINPDKYAYLELDAWGANATDVIARYTEEP